MKMTPGLPLVTVKSIENVLRDDKDLSGMGLKPEEMLDLSFLQRLEEERRGKGRWPIFDFRLPILDWGNGMNKTFWNRFSAFYSDNRKSKTCPELGRRIENLKWLGLSVIAFVLVVTGVVAQAQQPTKVPRVGWLTAASLTAISFRTEAFRQGLRELGYVEVKNIVIEWRSPEGKPDLMPTLAAELVRLKVDVIVTGGGGATRPAKAATSTIPIVMAQDRDPVGNGFVVSLARPGGNITGLSTLSPEISGKQLELLKEIVRRLARVAFLTNSNSEASALVLNEMETAAKALGVQLPVLDVRGPKDIETAFRAATKGRADAVLVLGGPVFNSQRTQIAALAIKSRLPAIYDQRAYVEAGGLMSYGVSFTDLDRRAATYVDKILKGAKPADLPVEQPTKFEFIINLKAAKQIGLTIPPNVLARADRVIRWRMSAIGGQSSANNRSEIKVIFPNKNV
jgi:putative tryptophan/tyrosine transport system substrate-binding protein